jgi:hypothetical protein
VKALGLAKVALVYRDNSGVEAAEHRILNDSISSSGTNGAGRSSSGVRRS